MIGITTRWPHRGGSLYDIGPPLGIVLRVNPPVHFLSCSYSHGANPALVMWIVSYNFKKIISNNSVVS